MHLNTEKTKSETDLAVFEEITNGMVNFIVKNYANLIKRNFELFGNTEFLMKREKVIYSSIDPDFNTSQSKALTLGICIEKLNALIKTKRIDAENCSYTLLSLAILLNDVQSVEKLLTVQTDFPHAQVNLLLAICHGNSTDIIKLLLSKEYFQNKLNLYKKPTDRSFLYYALWRKKFDIAKYLISKGAQFLPHESLDFLKTRELYDHPDLLKDVLTSYRASKNECDFTPFTQFATNFETLRLLLVQGACLMEPLIPSFLEGLHVTTSLKFAVYIGDLELCTQILEREKAPENIQEELYLAVFRNNPEVIKFLFQNCPLAQFDANLLLAKMIDLPLIKRHTTIPVILKNEHFNSKLTHDGFTYAFSKSLEKLKFGVAALLLKSNYFKYNSLTVASNIFTSIQKIHPGYIDKFCFAIKNIIHQPLGDYDFFSYALSTKNIMLVTSLVNNGADVNVVYKNNSFPLLLCAARGYGNSIAQILLLKTKKQFIRNTLAFCINFNSNDSISLIIKTLGREKFADDILNRSIMFFAVSKNNLSALDMLLGMYKDESFYGLTLLDFAILLENKQTIQCCQQAGMKTNFLKDYSNGVPIFCGHKVSEIPDQYLTFLRLCISSKPEDIAKLRNIDISNINVNYQLPNTLLTPLMLAALHQNEEAIKFLLEKGAKLDLTSQNDFTATDYADLIGSSKIIKLFPERDNSTAKTSPHAFFNVKNKRQLDEIDSDPSLENGKKVCN